MAENYTKLHHRLHQWYQHHGRHHLPWRNTADSYAIYISELMLQQTQVKTVLERFYHPFLAQFPTLQSIADAPQESVLKAWEGLGYYSRARNLHKAAQLAAPQLPSSVDALISLPGIGKNTAHAIAAFAHHQPVPVMEANLRRVLCRFFALTQPKEPALWEAAFTLLDPENPYDYNQAMMDLGAMLCTKTKPDCAHCPLSTACQGKATPEAYPIAKAKKPVPIRKRVILVIQDKDGNVLISPRQGRFLHGMYRFLEYDQNTLETSSCRLLGHIRHVYSHFALEADVYTSSHSEAITMPEASIWHPIAALDTLPLSGADKKVVALL